MLKGRNTTEISVLDAGAGVGRNSIYLAEKGFSVTAVEMDPESAKKIEIKVEKKYADNIEVINKPIQEAIVNIPNESIEALIDSGMSHYLSKDDPTNKEKEEFASQGARILKKGGFLVLLHFSENERLNPKWGRTREYLQSLYPDFDVIVDWKEIEWPATPTEETKKMENASHHAWTVTLRKK